MGRPQGKGSHGLLYYGSNMTTEKTSVREADVQTFVYPAKFGRGDHQGIRVVTFRDIPEAITQGKGGKDALWQASDCLEEAIAGRIADGREIPKASKPGRGERPIPVPAPMAAKATLYVAMRDAGMTNVQLARRLGCDEKEVGRILDPRHPTKLPRINEALDVLGKRLVVGVEEAA
jgi:antitoxin HicB